VELEIGLRIEKQQQLKKATMILELGLLDTGAHSWQFKEMIDPTMLLS